MMLLRINKLVALSALISIITACNSSPGDSSSARAEEQLATPDPTPETVSVTSLNLDFTFPAGELIEDLSDLAGLAVLPDNTTAALLTSEGELLRFSLDGVLQDRRTLSIANSAGGLTATDGAVLLSTTAGELLRYSWSDDTLEMLASLPGTPNIGGVAAISSGEIFTVDSSRNVLVRLDNEGTIEELDLAVDFESIELTGLDSALTTDEVGGDAVSDELLYAAGTDSRDSPPSASVYAISRQGALVNQWRIAGDPVALAVLDVSPRGPELLTANTDRTILKWEPEAPLAQVMDQALGYIGRFEIADAGGEQPSGIDYSGEDEQLYYVTDFGNVLSSGTDGGEARLLFDLDEPQGTYEALTVDARGNVVLLASDSGGTRSRLDTYDLSGTLVATSPLANAADSAVFEGYAIDEVSGAEVWVNSSPGAVKSIYTRKGNAAPTVQVLADEYTPWILSGIEVFEDEVLLLFAERNDVELETRLSGLVVIWDSEDGDEIGRFAVAAPGADGELAAVRNPSDLALAPDGTLFVTSDTAEGVVYAFDASALLD